MLVNVNINGQLEVNEADLDRLKRESISDLGAILQNRGKNVKKRVAEIYQKEEKPKEKEKVEKLKEKEDSSPPADEKTSEPDKEKEPGEDTKADEDKSAKE